MKIFLTGSSGFIGKNLVQFLGDKYQVTALSHQQLDLSDKTQVSSFLKEGKFDIVIHAANFGGSRSQSDVAGVLEGNKKMFLNLAKNSQEFGRMIFFGSGAEYGKQRDISNIKESDFGQIMPQDEYGLAKYFASEYIAKADQFVNFRLFGVFGPGEDYGIRFISNAICRSLNGMPIVLRQNAVFDYLYITDLMKIVDLFIGHKPKEKFYNVSGGQHYELLVLAEMVKKATGKNSEIIVKNEGLNKEYTCDNTLLAKELDGFAFTPMQQAIMELTNWYKDNWASVDVAKLNFDA